MFTLNELLQRQNESLHQLPQKVHVYQKSRSMAYTSSTNINHVAFGKHIIHHKHYLAPAVSECALKRAMLLI